MALSLPSPNSGVEEAMSSLSLGGTTSQESDRSRAINSVQQFLNAQPEQNLEDFIQEHLLPSLHERQKITRIPDEHPYFQAARHIWEREGWDGEGLSNYIKLLCGALDFPAIMLINPTGWDYLPWDEMIQHSDTLRWLQQTLEPLGFTLRDIIIVDAVPLLTREKMDSIEDAEKVRLSNELFNLTVEFLRQFKPPAIISCQCATRPSHPRWGIGPFHHLGRFVNNPLAARLSSSVKGAQRRKVARVPLDASIIHVIQGFHPRHIDQCEDPKKQLDLDQVLRGILETVYRPCANWKDQRRRECEEDLDRAAENVFTTMKAFLDAMTVYRRARSQAADFGTDSARLGTYNLSDWIYFRVDVRLFVSQMIRGFFRA